MALSDTPMKRAKKKWMALGRVEWEQEGPKKCQDMDVFTRGHQKTGGTSKPKEIGKIKGGLLPVGGGRTLGTGFP